MTQPRFVTHKVLADYAGERVNLKRDDVKDHRAQVGRLRDRLKAHIAEHPDYGFVKSRHSGSLAKGTALRRLNDMDLAVYVRAAEAPEPESELLSWMEARLKDSLKPLGLKEDQFELQAHCVKIRYVSSGLHVDVVPVIYEEEADDIGYLITKDTGDRVKTSVTQHLKFIRTRKDAQPDDFAQVVRFVKWWVGYRKQQDDDFRFKSFMVELICAHLADQGVDFSDYPKALEKVFGYIIKTGLRERIAFTDFYAASALPSSTGADIEIFDPVNAENNVAKSYTRQRREAIVEAAYDAFDAVTEAAYADTKGRSVQRWRTVLGPTFSG